MASGEEEKNSVPDIPSADVARARIAAHLDAVLHDVRVAAMERSEEMAVAASVHRDETAYVPRSSLAWLVACHAMARGAGKPWPEGEWADTAGMDDIGVRARGVYRPDSDAPPHGVLIAGIRRCRSVLAMGEEDAPATDADEDAWTGPPLTPADVVRALETALDDTLTRIRDAVHARRAAIVRTLVDMGFRTHCVEPFILAIMAINEAARELVENFGDADGT